MSRRPALRLLALIGSGLWLPAPSPAWQTNINGSATASSDRGMVVAIDQNGDVAAGGSTANSGVTVQDFTVVKLSGQNGTLLWRREFPPTFPGYPPFFDKVEAIAVDAAGDMIAGGVVTRTQSLRDFTVVKLAGTDGSLIWRRAITGSPEGFGEARALGIDGAGDVIAAGAVAGANFAVVKLSGTTGCELWRRVLLPSTNLSSAKVNSIAITETGDAVAGGYLASNVGGVLGSDFTIVKFSGADGVELWRAPVRSDPPQLGGEAYAVTVDAVGDVAASGVIGNSGFTVVKFDGATGSELWRGSVGNYGEARAVTTDAERNVLVAGNPPTSTDQSVSLGVSLVKFSGGTGAELWRSGLCQAEGAVALAVAVGADGNVTGVGAGGVTLTVDFVVASLNGSNGSERWCRVIRGTANGDSLGSAVALDGSGDPVAVGSTQNIGTGIDFTIVKVARDDGTERWRQLVNGRLNISQDRALAIAVDPDGDIAAAGETVNIGTARDFTAVKLDGTTGAQLWRQDLTGSLPGGIDRGIAVVVDPAADIIATGEIQNVDTGTDLAVVKFASVDGEVVWRQEVNGSANDRDRPTGVAVDRRGDAIVVGELRNLETSRDFLVAKFSGANGRELWRVGVNGTANGLDEGTGVALDSAGDVVAVGLTENVDTGIDFAVIKLGSDDGRELWRREINGISAMSSDQGLAVAIDQADNVVAAGIANGTSLGGAGETGGDLFVVKLDGRSGADIWQQAISGTDMNTTSTDTAWSVTVDEVGDVVAAGSLEQANNVDLQFTAVKLAGDTGREIWRYLAGSAASEARAVATDASGDAYVAGVTLDLNTTAYDFTVVKAAASDGQELWRRNIDGTSTTSENGGDDRAYAVTVDGSGGVIAAGFTYNAETGSDFTVIKLNSADGSSPGDTDTPAPSPTPIPTLRPRCFGDCSGDGRVRIDELVSLVDLLLRGTPSSPCLGGEVVTIDKVVLAVHNALSGCAG